jgi:predicted ATPase/transcriptional regulator with XRE-family HTH domain
MIPVHDQKRGGLSRAIRDRPTFAQLLRRHRVDSKLSQEELADRARVSVKAVGALERGERRAPYRETVASLAAALGLSAVERGLLEDAAAAARRRVERAANPAASSPKDNLPPRFTTFVGRDEEVADITALLQKHRLVTVTGAGGVGKTRTVTEVATRQLGGWEDGPWFVDLATSRAEGLLLGRIAGVLGVRVADVDNVLDAIVSNIRTRRILLILDNCEHVLESVSAIVRELLESCPNVTILATSRERVGLAAEIVYRLQGLATPDLSVSNVAEGLAYPAVALFVQRAAAIDNRFVVTDDRIDLIADICRDLDGLALAIELTAAQVPKLGLLTLHERLREQVSLLSSNVRDRPERQQTMLSTIAWSYDLLSEAEQTLFRRLAIFEYSWSLESAESVCAGEALDVSNIIRLLSSLVEKSLVVATPLDERMRYNFLESTRAFARAQLSATVECEALQERHAMWLAAFAEAAESRYLTAPRPAWLAEVEREVDNARGALQWALETACNAPIAGTIIGGLRGLCRMYGLTAESREWAEATLAQLDSTSHPRIAARLHRTIAQASNGKARVEAAKREITLLQRLGDRRGVGASFVMLAKGLGETGDGTEALVAIDAATRIFAEEGWRYELPYARALHERCVILRRQGRSTDIGEDLEEALSIATLFGDDWIALDLRVLLAEVASDNGDAEAAADLSREALAAARAKRWHIQEVTILNNLSLYLLTLGEIDEAERIAKDVLSRTYTTEPLASVLAIQHIATVAALRGHYRRAARLCGAVDAWCDREHWQRGPTETKGYGMLMNILSSHVPEAARASFAADGGCLSQDQVSAEALQA